MGIDDDDRDDDDDDGPDKIPTHHLEFCLSVCRIDPNGQNPNGQNPNGQNPKWQFCISPGGSLSSYSSLFIPHL